MNRYLHPAKYDPLSWLRKCKEFVLYRCSIFSLNSFRLSYWGQISAGLFDPPHVGDVANSFCYYVWAFLSWWTKTGRSRTRAWRTSCWKYSECTRPSSEEGGWQNGRPRWTTLPYQRGCRWSTSTWARTWTRLCSLTHTASALSDGSTSK